MNSKSEGKDGKAISSVIQYNTKQPHLIIPEYGRNIQKLIQYACTLKTKEERTNVAHAIIAIMGRLNPQLRDITDFRHKLWDHLFIISDFKLDINCPYPIPSKEILTTKPEKVKYPVHALKFKHYGKSIERLIEKASSMKPGDERNAFIVAIANLMKKSYLLWNRDSVNDTVILQELEILSKGKLKVPETFQFVNSNEILSRSRNRPEDSRDRDHGRGGRRHGRNNHRRHRDR